MSNHMNIEPTDTQKRVVANLTEKYGTVEVTRERMDGSFDVLADRRQVFTITPNGGVYAGEAA